MTTVSVVLPALNEEATVGAVVETITPYLGTVVHELVVMDSGSTDQTAARAVAAGAKVVQREEVLPHIPTRPGKGEVLWRSLAATTGDIVVFMDADLVDPDPQFVPKLIAPLLSNLHTKLVRGYYRRPLGGSDTGGGRVTELVARPLLAALRPELSSVVQPLGGEYAGRRELLAAIPFAPGYGVEIGILLDTYHRYGRAAIDQVNLGVRVHRNRSTVELGPMSRQIMATAFSRCGIRDTGSELTQFISAGQGYEEKKTAVSLCDRPPMNTLTAQPTRRHTAGICGAKVFDIVSHQEDCLRKSGLLLPDG